MLDRILVRGRAVPPDPPRRRGATMVGPDPRRFNLRGILGAIPWQQLMLGGAVILLAAMVPWGTGQLLTVMDRQIMGIDISGELVGDNEAALERQVSGWVGKSFFATDLAEVKAGLERRPWVESAAVRRVWPDRLQVEIREKKPLAYWNGDKLVSRTGALFAPSNRNVAGPLPLLSGPDERVADVIRMARTLSNELTGRGIGFAGLALEERGAWTLTLANGIEVSLGRDQVKERFERFITVYEGRLAVRADEVKRIDARYTNGVAVQWKNLETASGTKS